MLYRSHLKLKEYFGFKDNYFTKPPPQQATDTTVNDSGGSTPMPTETFSMSPAWNPSSHLSPVTNSLQADLDAEQAISSSAIRFEPQYQHVFLNPLLADKKLNAIVNGGEYKQKLLEITVSILQERVLLSHLKYGTSYPLKPEWVTPKHPSPTHDN